MNKIDFGAKKPKGPVREPGSCYLRDRCRGPNYHVCLAGKEDTFPRLLGEPIKPKKRRSMAGNYQSSDAQLSNLRAGRNEYWEEQRRINAPRDAEIVEKYRAGGIGYTALAKEYGLGRDTVLRILHDAQDRGELRIRPRGMTVLRGA